MNAWKKRSSENRIQLDIYNKRGIILQRLSNKWGIINVKKEDNFENKYEEEYHESSIRIVNNKKRQSKV